MADREKPPGRVFISHSSTDKTFARLVCEALREKEFSPWIDSEQIEAGETIIERIGDGLETMDVLTLIVSKASLASRWVAEELNFGLLRAIKDKQVALLPFIIDADLPLDRLPWFLQVRRVERVSPDAAGARAIAIAVAKALDRRSVPAPLDGNEGVETDVPPELASAREVEPGDWPSAQDIATNIVAQTQQSGRNDVFDALVAWVLSPAHKDHGCLIGVLSTIEKWTELMPQLVTRDLLWTMSSHPEFSVRSSSAAICMDWAQFAPNLVPVDVLFRLAVHDEDWYVQAPATAALKSLAHGQPSVLQWFYQRLGHPNAEARSHAAQAIADIADREPEILDGDELERAATRLTEMGDRDALKQLQRVVPTVKSVKRENSRYRYSL